MKPHTAGAVSCVTVEATRAARGRPGSPGRHFSEIDCAVTQSPSRGRWRVAAGAAYYRYLVAVGVSFEFSGVLFRYNSGSRDEIQCSYTLLNVQPDSRDHVDVIPPLDYRHHHIGGDCGIGDIDMQDSLFSHA